MVQGGHCSLAVAALADGAALLTLLDALVAPVRIDAEHAAHGACGRANGSAYSAADRPSRPASILSAAFCATNGALRLSRPGQGNGEENEGGCDQYVLHEDLLNFAFDCLTLRCEGQGSRRVNG